MLKRYWAPAAVATLLVCATAQAAPVTVNLRVEGASSTTFEGPVTTDGRLVDGGDGTGPHPCDGTNGGRFPTPGPTMISALADAPIGGGFSANWSDGLQDFLIARVAADAEDLPGSKFWGIALNYKPPMVGDAFVGGCQKQLSAGDEVLFGYDFFSKAHLLKLVGPQRASAGQPVQVTVTDGQDGTPLPAASVSGADSSTPSGPDGSATVTFSTPGVKLLKAARDDSLRSNALEVCVEQPGTNTCAGFTSSLKASGPDVNDSSAPVARISGPRNGRRYRRGPRLLKGVVRDDPSGVREVKLALRRHVRGRNCQWWSGRRDRFVGTSCKKVFFFSIGSSRNWSYLLPRALRPGRYVLDVKAFDGRRNRDEKFVSGRNRVLFEVVSRRARGTTAAAPRARGARVQVLVAGTGGALVEATTLRARPTVVRASGRACKVAGSTPLAALAAALRRTGARWHLRDFGSCARRRASSSAQLFVDRIDGDRNRGQDGWVYKVNDFARSVGAADVSGGRLRSGDRVLWLFCALDAASASCQRSLRVLPDAAAGPPGTSLRVLVRAYDNERRAVPAAGALVALNRRGGVAESTAVTGPDGVALLSLPAAPGRRVLKASAPGAVPSFPVSLTVR